MSEQVVSGRKDFRTVLREQQRRVVAAVAAEKTIDATPIVRDDEALTCEEYATLVYELHHVHLPELEAVGVIDFDRREDIVSRGERFDEARPKHKYGHDR